MRLLVDVHQVQWDRAWKIVQQVFSYTNHTLMPEALETWDVDMLARLLPRHLEIIFEINANFLKDASEHFGHDVDLIRRVSLVDEYGQRRVRMAHLAIVASQKVNGVSKLHSQLMEREFFNDFARMFPERFTNVTNGITPRRWLAQSSRPLSSLIDSSIGTNWRKDLFELSKLREFKEDPEFAAAFRAAKRRNKIRLAQRLLHDTGVAVHPDALFDMQVKRIHEYKRQLLNVLHVIVRYNQIRAHPEEDWVPRVAIFAGKAASAYKMAKTIIRLIGDVAQTINRDPVVGDRLKVVFVPNYGVSLAETMIPAADLSEQISMAGTEASGTGNMKLALNGALTIGTMDGANIEICDAVGRDNMFIFGLTANEVGELRATGYRPNRSTRLKWLDTPDLARRVIARVKFTRRTKRYAARSIRFAPATFPTATRTVFPTSFIRWSTGAITIWCSLISPRLRERKRPLTHGSAIRVHGPRARSKTWQGWGSSLRTGRLPNTRARSGVSSHFRRVDRFVRVRCARLVRRARRMRGRGS
jgi:starch phosphorylase